MEVALANNKCQVPIAALNQRASAQTVAESLLFSKSKNLG